MPNLDYGNIKSVLDQYDNDKKGPLRKKLGDYAYVTNVKNALNEAMTQAKSRFNTTIVPSIDRHDRDDAVDKKLIEINIFIAFYTILTKELNEKLPGKGSVQALKKIKEMILNTEAGRFADFWMEVNTAPFNQAVYKDFFIRVYLTLAINNLGLFPQKKYNIRQIKKLINLYPDRALPREIRLDERFNNHHLANFDACTGALTRDPLCLFHMANYYLTHSHAESSPKEILNSWNVAVILKKRNLDVLTPDIIKNQSSLNKITKYLLTSEPHLLEAMLTGPLRSAPWLTASLITRMADVGGSALELRLETLNALDKLRLLTPATLNDITNKNTNLDEVKTIEGASIAFHSSFDPFILRLLRNGITIDKKALDFILNRLAKSTLIFMAIKNDFLHCPIWHTPSFMQDLMALGRKFQDEPSLEKAVVSYLSAFQFLACVLPQINTPENRDILFEHTSNTGQLHLLWDALNLPRGEDALTDYLQHCFDILIPQLKKLSGIDINTLGQIPLRKRTNDFFLAIIDICRTNENLDECTERLNHHVHEIKKLADIETVYRAFFPADVRFLHLNLFSQRIADALPRFLETIAINEFSWIPDHHKNAVFFNDTNNLILQNRSVFELRNHIRAYHAYHENQDRRHALAANPMMGAVAANPMMDGGQNTHTASVHRTVSESAIRLHDYFKERKIIVNIDVSLENLADEITRNLDAMEDNQHDNDKKSEKYLLWLRMDSALKTVEKIQHPDYDYIDKKSKVSTKQLLSMAWLAINTEDLRTFTNADGDVINIVDRGDALMKLFNALYEVERGYNINSRGEDDGKASKPICAAGTFNKIMEGMVSTIRLVIIIMATKDYAFKELKRHAIEDVTSYLDAYPKTTDEERKQYSALLKTLKEDGTPEPIWEAIKDKMIKDFRSEFSILYANDLGIVDHEKLTQDLENTVIYLDISDLIENKTAAFLATQPKPSAQGLFAQQNSGGTANPPLADPSLIRRPE